MFHGARMRGHVHPYVRIPEGLRACMRTSATVRTRANPHTHECAHALLCNVAKAQRSNRAVDACMRVCVYARMLKCIANDMRVYMNI